MSKKPKDKTIRDPEFIEMLDALLDIKAVAYSSLSAAEAIRKHAQADALRQRLIERNEHRARRSEEAVKKLKRINHNHQASYLS